MKYIITEEHEEYLVRWQKFERFMRRRDAEIKDLILRYSKRPRVSEDWVIDSVIVEFSFIYDIDYGGETWDWVNHYIKDNYSDYINTIMSEK